MKVGDLKIGNGMLLGIAVVAAFILYNRDKLFGTTMGVPKQFIPEPGVIDYPEYVPPNTIPNQIVTSIQSDLMRCLTDSQNDPRAAPNCIQYARLAYARVARAYATTTTGGATTTGEVPKTTTPTNTLGTAGSTDRRRDWDRDGGDRDGGDRDWDRDRDRDRDRDGRDRGHDWHKPGHKHRHRWSRDRRWWWSSKHRRWRPHHHHDDDDDEDWHGWGRKHKWKSHRWGNRCKREFFGKCDSECEHGPGGRCLDCIDTCNGGFFGFWRPHSCHRFWSWHWGPCGPVGFPWWRPRWHKHHHYWSHDRRRWWDDRRHGWRGHHERDDDHGRGGWGGGERREHRNLHTAQDYGLTYYQKDWGLDYMRGR